MFKLNFQILIIAHLQCRYSKNFPFLSNAVHVQYFDFIIGLFFFHSEQDVVISVVKKLKGFTITDHVNDSTTHVVCGGPRRTLNILHAITRGCWIVRKEWVCILLLFVDILTF